MAEKEISRTDIFENVTPLRAILMLAVPNIINQLANVIYNLADTFYIGKLNNSSMVAALSITAPVMLILTATSNLFCVGSCAVIASALGSKNKKKAEDVALMTPFIAAATGLVIGIFTFIFQERIALYSGASQTSLIYTMQYQRWVISFNALPFLCSQTIGAGLRGRGYSKYEMFGITFGNVLNIILDPLFIFVLDMKVTGAAVATFLSSCCSFIFFLFIAAKMQKKEHLYSELKGFTLDASYIRQVLATGFPAFFNSLLTSVTNTLQMNILKGYSDAAVASMGITRKIEHTFGQIIIGMAQGIIPLLSYNRANRNFQRLKAVLTKTRLLAFIWGLVSIAIIFPFAEQIIRIFINDQATVNFGIPVVRAFAFMPLLMSYHNVSRTALQALGEKKASTFLSIVRQIVFFLPLLLILDHFFGFFGAACTVLVSDLLTNVIALLLMRRVLSRIQAECEAADQLN